MKRIFFVSVFSCSTLMILAQKPTALFNWHRDSLPLQQIYIHFDKEAYVAGDTVWFKGYLYSNYAPSSLSTNFYVDLVDRKGIAIRSFRFPVIEGTALGNFTLPKDLKQAVYIVRAYSNWTNQLDPSFVFRKAIPVFNSSNTSTVAAPSTGILFEFYPESGRILNGLTNNIAFRAMDEKFQPVPVNADLLDSKDNKIGNFAKAQSEGVFSFTPVSNEKYYASVTRSTDATPIRIQLPDALDKGAVLILADEEGGKSFSALFSPGLVKEGDKVDLLGVINNHVVLETKVVVNRDQVSGLISTRDFPPGIMHLFLFDSRDTLLAQRTTLVQKEDLMLSAELKLNESGKLQKENNAVTVSFPEMLNGNFSISVTNADRELLPPGGEDISSTLLVQSGSSKFIINPRAGNESETDILTLSNKWFGYDPALMSNKIKRAADPDNYITIKGKALSRDGTPVTESTLNLYVQPRDFMQKTYPVHLDSTGSFILQGLVFEDTAKFFYELVSSKKNRKPAINLILSEPKEDFSALLKDIDYSFAAAKEFVFTNASSRRLSNELQKALLENPIILPEVVKETKSKKESVNNRYARGLFNSSPAKSYDFINNPPSVRGGTNVFDYLQGQIGGLTIEKAGGGYNLWSSRAMSIFMGNRNSLIAGKVFLDEVESNSQVVMRIPIDQIALVKYFEPGSLMLPGVGASPIFAVWTKKPEDMMNAAPLNLDHILFPGYSQSRIFSQPLNMGNRTTIYWNPDIIVNNGTEFIVEFYNLGDVKKVRIVAEGFTPGGKLLHIDKVIEQ